MTSEMLSLSIDGHAGPEAIDDSSGSAVEVRLGVARHRAIGFVDDAARISGLIGFEGRIALCLRGTGSGRVGHRRGGSHGGMRDERIRRQNRQPSAQRT